MQPSKEFVNSPLNLNYLGASDSIILFHNIKLTLLRDKYHYSHTCFQNL